MCSRATPIEDTWVEEEIRVLPFQLWTLSPELPTFWPCQKQVLNKLKGLRYFKKLLVNVGGLLPKFLGRIEIELTGLDWQDQ